MTVTHSSVHDRLTADPSWKMHKLCTCVGMCDCLSCISYHLLLSLYVSIVRCIEQWKINYVYFILNILLANERNPVHLLMSFVHFLPDEMHIARIIYI